MKNGVKFFIIIISILLLFSITLGSCISIISSYRKEQSYNTDESFMSVIGGISTQREMQEKFGVYNHEKNDSENGKTVLQIFSEDQAVNITNLKANGKTLSLTYDEALFLINDSVRLYFEYDTIELYGAYITGILSAESSLSSKAIDCYHGDFSEFNYDGAVQAYNQMLNDIYSIIYHRIAMLDSRLTTVAVIQHEFSGPPGYGFAISFEGDYAFDERKDPLEFSRQKQHVIVFDDGKSTEEEYKELVKATLLKKYPPVYFPGLSDTSEDNSDDDINEQIYDYPFIQLCGFSSEYEDTVSSAAGYTFFPVNPAVSVTNTNNQTNRVFPHKELADLCPQWRLAPEYFNTDSITVNLKWYYNNANLRKTYQVASITDKQIISEIINSLGELQTISDAINNDNENPETSIYAEEQCFYEIDLNNGTSVILPVNEEYKTAACIYNSNENPYSIPVLYNGIPEGFINTVRSVCKPYAGSYIDTDENGKYIFSVKTIVAEKYSEITQEKKIHFYGKYRELRKLITPSMTESDYHSVPEYSALVHLLSADKDYCWIALKYSYTVEDTSEQLFILRLAASGAGGKYTITDDLTLTESALKIYYLLTAGLKYE